MGIDRELRRLSRHQGLAQLCSTLPARLPSWSGRRRRRGQLIRAWRRAGLYCNYRFSPGYGDLPLSVQPTVLAALDAQRRLGITLSSSLLMTPTKSVTAIIGMFKEPQPKSHPSCAGCPLIDFCKIRPTGRTCRG